MTRFKIGYTNKKSKTFFKLITEILNTHQSNGQNSYTNVHALFGYHRSSHYRQKQ